MGFLNICLYIFKVVLDTLTTIYDILIKVGHLMTAKLKIGCKENLERVCEPRGRAYPSTLPKEISLGQHKIKNKWTFAVLAPGLLVLLLWLIFCEWLEFRLERLKARMSLF